MYVLEPMIRVNLKALLEQRGISQRELARRTNTHPDVISRFAREATSGVSYELLDRICMTLDCSPADLLRYEDVQTSLFGDVLTSASSESDVY